MDKPSYPHRSIASLESLALALNMELSELCELKDSSDSLYYVVQKKVKKDGSVRLVYDVKPKLKKLHGKICDLFLKEVSYPDYLQGGLKKRSYLSNAAKHCDSEIIFSEDITNFFPSISKKVVIEIWMGFFCFSEEVAEFLSELLTYKEFLVQGAKPSGYLCNLALWNRESNLVTELKSKGFIYTRYVDDITVSCHRVCSNEEKSEVIRKIYSLISTIGAKPNRRKHKIMHKGSHQSVHGVNVSRCKPTMSKEKRKAIRAAVHQCEREFDSDKYKKSYHSLYKRTLGRVNHLGQIHPKSALELKERLSRVRPR